MMNTALQGNFRIHTAALQPLILADQPDQKILQAVGSSTIIDLDGDKMLGSALEDMSQAPVGLLIFRNHSYTLPDDLVGSLIRSPVIRYDGGIADLEITFDIEETNPKALQIYQMAQNGRKMGVSIGCIPTDYVIDDGHLIIAHVQTLEWSTVGIPANQRSWIENAAAALFLKHHDPQVGAIVKSLMPADYAAIIDTFDDSEERNYFERLPARHSRAQYAIYWYPNSGAFGYELRQSNERDVQIMKTLQRTELQQQIAAVTKAASGKTTWPLADRDRAWDNGEAHKRIVSWATDSAGAVDWDKVKSVHFWYDDTKADLWGSYKLLFCDVVGNAIQAIPRAIFACAGSHGIETATIPDSDLAGVKNKIASYYAKMAREFDDPTITPPWENKQGTPMNTKAKDEAEENGPEIREDGTHAAWTGTHTHAHTDQRGDSHTHTHDHTNDADHSTHTHTADAEKAATPSVSDGAPSVQRLSANLHALQNMMDAMQNRMTLFGEILDQLADMLPGTDATEKSAGASLQKAGRALSAGRKKLLQKAHHAIVDAAGRDLCASYADHSNELNPDMQDNDDSDDTADADDAAMKATMPAIQRLVETTLQKSLQTALEPFTKSLGVLVQDISTANQEISGVKVQIDALTNMGLGRPTEFHRSITPDGRTASLQDMVQAGKAPEHGAIVVMQGIKKQYFAANTGNRPALTPYQMAYMTEGDEMRYLKNQDVYVPVTDDAH